MGLEDQYSRSKGKRGKHCPSENGLLRESHKGEQLEETVGREIQQRGGMSSTIRRERSITKGKGWGADGARSVEAEERGRHWDEKSTYRDKTNKGGGIRRGLRSAKSLGLSGVSKLHKY